MIGNDPPWYHAANRVWDSRRIAPITPRLTERPRQSRKPKLKLGSGKSVRIAHSLQAGHGVGSQPTQGPPDDLTVPAKPLAIACQAGSQASHRGK
jgi:hypothetical protein